MSAVVPGIFADEIGLACNEVVAVARMIGALSTRMTAGTGLRLQPRGTTHWVQAMASSRRVWTEVMRSIPRETRVWWGACAPRVAASALWLRVLLGPMGPLGTERRRPTGALDAVRARVVPGVISQGRQGVAPADGEKVFTPPSLMRCRARRGERRWVRAYRRAASVQAWIGLAVRFLLDVISRLVVDFCC